MQFDPASLMRMLQERGISMSMSGDSSAPRNSAMDHAVRGDAEGRSRKLRDVSWEMQGPLAALEGVGMITTPSPVVPLKFEQPAGQWQGCDYIATEFQGVMSFSKDYINPSVLKAHMKALEAYGCCSPQQAIKTAHEALAICELCPEAYNVLALSEANSYDEALKLYQKAVELGPKVLFPERFDDAVEEGAMWGKTPYRPYFRAMYGVANTLRKLGRYAESLAVYDKLIALDPNWYQWTSYVNIMALYPWVLLGAKGPEALLSWMKRYKHTEDHFTYISSSVYWEAAYVLADLLITEAKGVRAAAGGAAVTPDDKWAADGLDLGQLGSEEYPNPYTVMKKGRGLHMFVQCFPGAVDMLLGDKAVPSGVPPSTQGKNDAAQAGFVYTVGSMWRSRPTAMERLRRYRNTFELKALVGDLRAGLPVDIQDIKHYVTAPGGFHTHCLERLQGPHSDVRSLLDLMTGHPDGNEFTKNELKVLKWLLDAGCPVHNDHPNSPPDSPLHMACYQGYGPDAVKLLLAAGADPFRRNIQGLTALQMTANQGSWREMQAIFQALPHLKAANAAEVGYGSRRDYGPLLKKLLVPEALLLDLFQSSVLPCLEGGPRCNRCSNGIPHSKHASFFRYVEVLLAETGLTKLNKAALEEIEDWARRSGPGSPWAKLYKYVLRTLDSTKKAAAAAAAKLPQPAPAAAAAADAARASSNGVDISSSSSKLRSKVQQQGSADRREQGKKQCWGCGKKAGAAGALKKCSGCAKAWYCSADCQNSDWKARHKAECKTWRAENAQ